MKFLKRSFTPLRDFRDLADANEQLREWVLGEAGNRVHGTTYERPLTRFTETERAMLQPLPDVAPEPAAWAKVKVHRDGHVRFEKCRYSVPYPRIGETLWLRAKPDTVHVFADHILVASHPRLKKSGGRSTVDDHLPPEALAFKRQNPVWCRGRAEEIGPACHGLIDELLDRDRLVDQLRAAQAVLRLAKGYGETRLEAACHRATSFGDVRYRTVKTILEKGLDQSDDNAPSASPGLAAVYTGAGRYLRDLTTVFTSEEACS